MSRNSSSPVRSDGVRRLISPLDRRRFLRGVGGSALAAAALAGGGSALVAGGPSVLASARQVDASPRDGLEALLALIPGSIAADAVGSGTVFYHADLKAQFDALGVDRTEPDWIEGIKLVPTTMSLALASRIYPVALSEIIIEGLGFAPLEVDRTLEVGVLPPSSLTIFQGGLDREHMESAWEASGYEPVSLDDGFTLWTIGEEGELDMKNDLSRAGIGAFNNLLMLDDDTLVMSRMGEIVRTVVAHVAQGRDAEGNSLLAMPQVEPAVRALLPTTASSVLLSGSALVPRMSVDISDGGTPVLTVPSGEGDGPEMPAAAMAIFGIEAGFLGQSDDDAGSTPVMPGETPIDEVKRAQVRLAMRSGDDAATAVEIVPERWETLDSMVNGEPFADLMALIAAEVSPEEPTVAAFDFDQGVVPNRWLSIVNMLDLLPFSPGSV